MLPQLGRTRRIACLLVEAPQPLTLLPRAEWPELAALNARRLASGDLLTVLRWSRPLAAQLVLAELARQQLSHPVRQRRPLRGDDVAGLRLTPRPPTPGSSS